MQTVLNLAELWCVLAVVFLLGEALTRTSPWLGVLRQPYARLFFTLLWGSVALAVLTAVAATRGRTVLVFVTIPVLGLFGLGRLRPSRKTPGRLPLTTLLELGGLSAFFFSSQWLPLCKTPPGPLGQRIPHPDVVFFGFLSDSMLSTGQESVFPYVSRYMQRLAGATPYHYFELWLAGASGRLFSRPAAETYSVVVIPLLATIAVVGFWAIAAELGSGSLLHRLALVATPLLGSWALRVPNGRFFAGMPMLSEGPLPLVGKSLVIYVVLVAAVLLVLEGCADRALTFLLLLLPLSQIAAPAAGGAILCGACLLAARGKRAQAILPMLLLALVAAGMVGFYLATGCDVGFASLKTIAETNSLPALWRTKLNVLGKTTLQLLLLYSVHAIVTALMLRHSPRRERVAQVAVAGTLFAAMAVFGYAALSSHLLAVEFASVPVPPMVWLILITAFASWRPRREGIRRLCLTAVCIVAVLRATVLFRDARSSSRTLFYADRYSTEYLESVSAVAPRCQRGGYLLGSSDAGDPWDREKPVPSLALAYQLGSYLALVRGCASPTFLGSFGLQHPNSNLLEMSPLAIFAKAVGEGPADELTLGRFVRETGLQFVIASASATIPPSIQDEAERTIVDPGTGERFLVLRPQPTGPTL